MFADRVEIEVKAGKGGDGLASFRRDRLKAKGGPDGGDGGDGGSVVLQADHNLNTLVRFRNLKLVKAEPGKPGGHNRQHGKSGADAVVKVPLGTVVWEGERMLADLAIDGQQAVIARGGRGGFGNAHFVSSTRQAPRAAELGEPGESKRLVLELKLVADVGLVGLPNAGKSTFLSVISNAKPEIADYPFTTVIPNLGMATVDGENLLVADIPGLIAGASQGKGLGDEFLRHTERTSVLIHLIDINQPNLADAYATIQAELVAYKVDLSDRPQLVTLTKVETLEEQEAIKRQEQLEDVIGAKVYLISAVAQRGLVELLRAAKLQVDQARKTDDQAEATIRVIGLEDFPDQWQVLPAPDGFRIEGEKITRFGLQTDFNNPHAMQRLRDIMVKMGVTKELERQNVKPGSIITLAGKSFEW